MLLLSYMLELDVVAALPLLCSGFCHVCNEEEEEEEEEIIRMR
jgi:hypothetical protein